MNLARTPISTPPSAAPRGRFALRSLAGACLAAVALAATLRAADDWAPNFTGTTVWNSNATNANVSSDQIDSLAFKGDILSSKRFGLSGADSLNIGWHLGGEWWPRYEGLAAGAAGVRGEWQHKFGLGALAPVFSAEIAFDGVLASEDGRSGSTTGVTFSLRKRFNDVLRATVSHEIARQDARLPVYDREGNETTIELDRDLNAMTRVTLGVRYRNGDVLSYATPPRPDLVELAPQRLAVDTFDRVMTVYSVDARTWSARAALTRAIDDQMAIIGAYEWRNTRRNPLRYVNHLVSVSLVYQF